MKQLWHTVVAFVILSVITGIIYPLVIMGMGHVVFPYQAGGSLLQVNGAVIGSELIGQKFTSDKYLWGRPSATTGYEDNPLASGGSNLAPSNPDLLKAVQGRVLQLHATPQHPVPIDLVTSSASGIDPNISVASAYFQMDRIAKARGIRQDAVQNIIDTYAKAPLWGIWGEDIVNVLDVNLALDKVTALSIER